MKIYLKTVSPCFSIIALKSLRLKNGAALYEQQQRCSHAVIHAPKCEQHRVVYFPAWVTTMTKHNFLLQFLTQTDLKHIFYIKNIYKFKFVHLFHEIAVNKHLY